MWSNDDVFDSEDWKRQPLWFGWYRRDGTPFESMEDFKLTKDYDYTVIKNERLWNGAWISTVWLGLDHSWESGSPPLIFETMVFWGSWGEREMDRYSTMDEAIAGHIRMKWKCRTLRWTLANWRSALRDSLVRWWKPFRHMKDNPVEDLMGKFPFRLRHRLEIWWSELKTAYSWPPVDEWRHDG